MTLYRIGNETERVFPESCAELLAAVVRFGCHLEQRLAYAYAASDRKVLRGEIEVDDQVVPGQLERLAVRDEAGDVELHHRELSLRFPLGPAFPGISRQSGDGVQHGALGSFSSTSFTSPDEKSEPTFIEGCRRKGCQQGIQFLADTVSRGVASRTGIDQRSTIHDASCLLAT